jgi:hypothetical protein
MRAPMTDRLIRRTLAALDALAFALSTAVSAETSA